MRWSDWKIFLPIVVNTVQANNHESAKLHSAGLDVSRDKRFSKESSFPVTFADQSSKPKLFWFHSSFRSSSLEISGWLFSSEATFCVSSVLKTYAPNKPYRIKMEIKIALYRTCALVSAEFMLLACQLWIETFSRSAGYRPSKTVVANLNFNCRKLIINSWFNIVSLALH